MNTLDAHPITRQRVLDRFRGIKRSAIKMRDKLRVPGTVSNEKRHELYNAAEAHLKYINEAIRLLDEARPKPKKKR